MSAGRRRDSQGRLPPLRRIVGWRKHPTYGFFEEVYECGHCLQPREDIMGATVGVRRRCLPCMRNQPALVDPKTLFPKDV